MVKRWKNKESLQSGEKKIGHAMNFLGCNGNSKVKNKRSMK